MIKHKYVIIILVLYIFFISITGVLAESEEQATIVNFDVTLNGILVNNINSDYPLLMYKGITYFPLTWDYSRFLGIETNWSQALGLVITKTGKAYDYKPSENTINQTQKKYSVVIPDYNITINGKKIDNKTEKWPLINFRGITYFPLTWRFAADSFGWEYSWSQETGLIISCPEGKSNPKETVLSIINQMAFGTGYSFNATITENQTDKIKYDYPGRVENRMDDINFISSVFLEVPVYVNGVKLNGLSTIYQALNPHQKEGYSLDFNANSSANARAVGPYLMESKEVNMMKQLLNLHFIGDNREKIISFENLETLDRKTLWEIKTENRTIQLKINNSRKRIIGITITDDLFTYTISF